MRAIIIDDKDCKQLLASLELAKLQERPSPWRDNPDKPVTFADVHRVFHCVVVGWLHDQGADLK